MADGRWYTTTTCRQCGALVDGLAHRYACGLCGWVSPPEDEQEAGPAP